LNALEQLRGPRLYTYEILFRIALAFLGYLLPAVFYADVQHYFEVGKFLDWDSLPYRDFTWEFPPLNVFALLLVPLTGTNTLAYHVVFVVLMVVCEWTCMHLLRRSEPRRFWSITAYWTAVVVPLSFLAWNRLDFVSVLFVVLGLIAIAKGKPVVHWVILGFIAKLWPLLLCVGLFAGRRFKQLGYAVAGVVVITALWYAFSPDGFHRFLEFRRGDGFQIESLPGSILHHFGREFFFKWGTVSVDDAGWQWLQPVMFAATVVSVGALALVGLFQKERDDVMLIGACVALTLVFSRIISTQFLVWLAPFIALRASTHMRIAMLYAISVAFSLGILCFYDDFVDTTGSALTALQVARNVALSSLAIAMTYAAVRPNRRDVALPSEQAGAEPEPV
jgi:hypothetical protein